MFTTPFSRLNISCICTECTNFLRPYPKDPPPIRFPPGLGLDLPPTPAITPKLTPQHTPRLRPTAPTLAPSPSFLLTRSSPSRDPPSKLKIGARAALPSLELSPTWRPLSDPLKKVTFASRSLWASISSPIDDAATPISAKTPGLASCAQETCTGKVISGFGRTVCRACEEELRGAVLGLATLLEEEEKGAEDKTRIPPRPSRVDSVLSHEVEIRPASTQEPHNSDERSPEPALFAVPSTPPSTKLFITHSLHSTPTHNTKPGNTPDTDILFALPDTQLDKTYEELTPTTKYALDFPALPVSKSTSFPTSMRNSKHNSAGITKSAPSSPPTSRPALTATESTLFSLHASNASVKWRFP